MWWVLGEEQRKRAEGDEEEKEKGIFLNPELSELLGWVTAEQMFVAEQKRMEFFFILLLGQCCLGQIEEGLFFGQFLCCHCGSSSSSSRRKLLLDPEGEIWDQGCRVVVFYSVKRCVNSSLPKKQLGGGEYDQNPPNAPQRLQNKKPTTLQTTTHNKQDTNKRRNKTKQNKTPQNKTHNCGVVVETNGLLKGKKEQWG